MLSEQSITNAVTALRAGGVIAYPTEHCFGLGCDPMNVSAIERLLKIKGRQREQGVILIVSDIAQLKPWVDLPNTPMQQAVLDSWPGPNTWLLPAHEAVSTWVRGKHATVAMRIPDHDICNQLCSEFGGAIVSTSANRHGQNALLTAEAVKKEMHAELDYVVEAPVAGAAAPSLIRSGITGERIR